MLRKSIQFIPDLNKNNKYYKKLTTALNENGKVIILPGFSAFISNRIKISTYEKFINEYNLVKLVSLKMAVIMESIMSLESNT